MEHAEISDLPVIASCIGRDRLPTPAEIDRLAGRIWRETHPGDKPWESVAADSEQHAATIGLAFAAVGLPVEGRSDEEVPSSELDWDLRRVLETANGNQGHDAGAGRPGRSMGSDLNDEPLSDADFRVLAAFREDLRRFLRFSESAAEEAGITAQQYQALLALRASGGRLSVGELADQMLLQPHSASGLISRMEAAGLVERLKPDGDARRVEVHLADAGSALLSSLAMAHREELKRMRPMLGDLNRRLA